MLTNKHSIDGWAEKTIVTSLLNTLNFRFFLYYMKWLETGGSCQGRSLLLCSRETREGRMKGGREIPSMGTTISRLSLSPCVKALCNIHCACIVNFYLPGSSFDKSVFPPSFRPHSMEQGNLPPQRTPFLPIILIKVIPFLNKKVHTSKGGILWGF